MNACKCSSRRVPWKVNLSDELISVNFECTCPKQRKILWVEHQNSQIQRSDPLTRLHWTTPCRSCRSVWPSLWHRLGWFPRWFSPHLFRFVSKDINFWSTMPPWSISIVCGHFSVMVFESISVRVFSKWWIRWPVFRRNVISSGKQNCSCESLLICCPFEMLRRYSLQLTVN